MKFSRKIFLLIIVLATISIPINVSATTINSSKGIYGTYTSFNHLYDAYQDAIKKGDTRKQEELLAIGRSSLEAEMEISSDIIQPQYDPDQMYWINQFPNYFSYGRFETRSNGITLSLGNFKSYWSSTDKINGWNSVYAKFASSSNWNNTNIMKEQLYCHARLGYAAIEAEWNLEPWRTSMNPITCN